MLEANQLTYRRGEQLILKNVRLSLAPSTLLHITGPNGAGKTTLLKLLVGILSWQEGAFLWENRIHSPHHPDYLSQVLYLGHHNGLKLTLSPLENLKWLLEFQNEFDKPRVLSLLTEMDLSEVRHSPLENLSKGQQSRVALIRLKAQKRRLWILDEPFTYLDNMAKYKLQTWCVEHLLGGGSILLASHTPLLLDKANIHQNIHQQTLCLETPCGE